MNKKYRNTSFLVEMLINVLVFSISCAIIVGVFGKASELTRNTREESYALAEIYTMFEKVRGAGPSALEDGLQEGEDILYYYDENWNITEADDLAKFVVKLQMEVQDTGSPGELSRISAQAHEKSGREICTLETAVYMPDMPGKGVATGG